MVPLKREVSHTHVLIPDPVCDEHARVHCSRMENLTLPDSPSRASSSLNRSEVSPCQNSSACDCGQGCWCPQCSLSMSAGLIAPGWHVHEAQHVGGDRLADYVPRQCDVPLMQLPSWHVRTVHNRLVVSKHETLLDRDSKISQQEAVINDLFGGSSRSYELRTICGCHRRALLPSHANQLESC
jgi:hypothetical protein